MEADFNEVAGDVSSCDVQPACEVGQRKALVHRADVGDSIAGVNNHPGQQACRPGRVGLIPSFLFSDILILSITMSDNTEIFGRGINKQWLICDVLLDA